MLGGGNMMYLYVIIIIRGETHIRHVIAVSCYHN